MTKEYCPYCIAFHKYKNEVELIYLADSVKIHECRFCSTHGIIEWDPDKDD